MSRPALIKTFALTAVLAPLWAGTALAWTGDDVAKRLQALLKEQMVELTFSKTETNDAADDVYLIETASFDDVKIVEDNSVFTTSDIRFNNVRLTKDPKTDLIGRLQYAESFQIGAISVTVQSKPVFELKGVHFAQEPFSKEKASNYSWGIEALNIDLEEVDRIDQEKKKQRAAELQESVEEAAKAAEEAAEEAAASAEATTETTEPATADAAPADKAGATADADSNTDIATDDTDEMAEDSDLGEDLAETSGDMDMAAIRALGLEKINLTMDAKGSWSPYSGQYTVDQMTVSGKNIGTYNYKLAMGGYNLKFIKAV
uniref:Uncharacterized protein n=1 Tax=Panagrolaimus superbus TaxID=310955 RepID=A0A914Z749_9BILA